MAAPMVTFSTWGPLAEPARNELPAVKDPWRDKARVWFWDAERRLYGTYCAFTSPDGGGRARLRVSLPSGAAELVEPLEPGTLGGSTIRFDLEESLSIESDDLAAELEIVPRLAAADSMAGWVIPSLIPGEPLHRWQQGATVGGWVRVGERTTTVNGLGLRSRSWGYCNVDERVVEQVAVVAGFGSCTLTAKTFRGMGGATRTEGFLLSEGHSIAVASMAVCRDGRDRLASARVCLIDGTDLVVAVTDRIAKSGMVEDCEEFVALATSGGECGRGVVSRLRY